MPPVGGVVIEGQQPQEGPTVLRPFCPQQLDGHLHPVCTLDQQEPGLEHSVVPPTGWEEITTLSATGNELRGI